MGMTRPWKSWSHLVSTIYGYDEKRAAVTSEIPEKRLDTSIIISRHSLSSAPGTTRSGRAVKLTVLLNKKVERMRKCSEAEHVTSRNFGVSCLQPRAPTKL